MKYLCKIKMVDGSRFEFETENKGKVDPGDWITVSFKDKTVVLNKDHVVSITLTKGE